MATANPPLHGVVSTDEENFFRLTVMIVNFGLVVLRDVLDEEFSMKYSQLFDPTTKLLYNILSNSLVKKGLFKLPRSVFNRKFRDELYPNGNPSSTVTTNDLDITLVVLLLRNITSLNTNPVKPWMNPDGNDTSKEAKIGRIKQYRNKYAHAKEAKICDADFKKDFQDIKTVLMCLSGRYSDTDYDEIKHMTLDSGLLEKYKYMLKEWVEYDRQIRDEVMDLRKKTDEHHKITTEKLDQHHESQSKKLDKHHESHSKSLDKIGEKLDQLLAKPDCASPSISSNIQDTQVPPSYTPSVSQGVSQLPVMSSTHKNLLVQMGQMLIENLQIEDILSDMVKSGTITEQNAKKIRSKNLEQDQVSEFLQILPICGPHAFGKFVHALRMHNKIDLADELDKKATEFSSKNQLANFYIDHMSRIQRLPWDPNDTMHIDEVFVNLQWVKEENKPTKTGTSLSPVHNYESIFSNTKEDKKPKRILIRGKAGIGKTTCTQKMATDWANTALGLKQCDEKLSAFSHLLVLNLRQVKPKQTLKDAIKMQLMEPRGCQHDVTEEIMNSVHHDSSNVLLILDGYDEYDPKTSKEITNIIHNRMHQNVCTVITTRPWKAENLMNQQIMHGFYEITGLTEENMVQYVANFFNDNEQYKSYQEAEMRLGKARKMQNAIGHGLIGYICEKELQSLAKIPILLLFICLLWQEEQQSGEETHVLPASYTLLYEKLIELLIRRRYSAKTKTAMNSYSEKLQQSFIDLGKLALDGLLKPDGGLVFDDDNLLSIPLVDELYSIGLLSKSKVHFGLDVLHAITFPHKTIQEFFAAKYLVQTVEKDDSALEVFLNQLETQEKLLDFHYVLRFACGLSKKATPKILMKASHIVEKSHVLNDLIRTTGITYSIFFWASHRLRRYPILCNDLLFEHWNAYSNKNKTLPPELQHWRRVLILPNSLQHSDPTFQQVLQDSVFSDPQPCDFQDVNVIAFESLQRDDETTNKLSALLNKCKIYRNLTTFMDTNSRSIECCHDPCHIVSNAPNLGFLSVGTQGISISSISNPSNMRHLHISVNLNIIEQDIMKLRQMTSLETVRFIGRDAEHPSVHCASSLGELPQISHHLTYIVFQSIPLGAAGVQQLGESLHYVQHLTSLKLIRVFNDRDDDRCRTRCICSEGSDQHYQYGKCEHVCDALTKLSAGVTHTAKLKKFSFHRNYISIYHGISSPLISLIQSLSTVSQQTDMSIDMSLNVLGCVDHLSKLMKAIVSSYQHVAEWDLRCNRFGDNVTQLTHGLDKLHSVKLRRIGIGVNGDEEAERRVKSEFMKHVPEITCL